jgi:hypothetical protein
MIPKGQTDLTRYGTFFSLVIIYAMNIALLAGFLIIAAPEVSCRSFGRELLLNTENLCEKAWPWLVSVYHWLLPANSL